jgi:hypothetical protein
MYPESSWVWSMRGKVNTRLREAHNCGVNICIDIIQAKIKNLTKRDSIYGTCHRGDKQLFNELIGELQTALLLTRKPKKKLRGL